MLSARKWFTLCGILALGLGGLGFSVPANALAPDSDEADVLCVVDVSVETRNQSGTVVGTETYHKEFLLSEGGFFSDDFSTRTRFKFLDASFSKINGNGVLNVDWFADVSVFNSVDFSTSVVLGQGRHDGTANGSHTFYSSTSSTRTNYSVTCTEL